MESATALLDLAHRSARKLLAALIASACALLGAMEARALSTQVVLDPSTSLVAMGGDFANYPPNTALTLTLDFDHVVGQRVPISLGNFFLPAVPLAWDSQDLFSVPSAFPGTLDLGTGVINFDSETVQFHQTTHYTVTKSSSFSFRLTTGPISGPPCGLFPGGPLTSGTPLDFETGDATLVALACVAATDPDTLFGVRLVGRVSGLVLPLPEPGTLLLMGLGLPGLVFARRALPPFRSRGHL